MIDNTVAYSGLTMGMGTIYRVGNIAGLIDMPDIRSADRVRLRRHGDLAGDDFAGQRDIEVSILVDGTALDGPTYTAAMDALLTATRPGRAEMALTFRIPGVAGGGDRQVLARPRKRTIPLEPERYGIAQAPEVTVLFTATDPRIYDAALQTGTSTLPTAGGGLTFNVTPNLVFGAVSTGGSIFALNAGTFPTSPTFRIDGPVTNPRIENLTSGLTLSLNITLGVGDFLLIDSEARTILLGGTASRYSSLAVGSSWFSLDPGTSEVRFRATTPTAAQLTMSWRSAWL